MSHHAPSSDHARPASPLLISGAEAAKRLGVSKAHFYRMHNAGRVPEPVRLGGAVRWRVEELKAWVEAGMPPRHRWYTESDERSQR